MTGPVLTTATQYSENPCRSHAGSAGFWGYGLIGENINPYPADRALKGRHGDTGGLDLLARHQQGSGP
jgi:hypothetical protein